MLSCDFDIHMKVPQYDCCDVVTFAKQPQENMFGPDVSVIERSGFLRCQHQDFLHARRVEEQAANLLIRAGADLLFDFKPHGLEIESHLPEHNDCCALSKSYQPKEQMFGTDEVMIEAISLLGRQRQHLLGA